MEPYDPNKRYFGPQGSWLCKLIPEYPAGIPHAQPIFNEAGYHHDVGYEGEERKGFFGWILDAMERRKIDIKLFNDLLDGINTYEEQGILSEEEADTCEAYAKVSYEAIRAGGGFFFRKNKD